MGRRSARGSTRADLKVVQAPVRLARADRREDLLDAAAWLIVQEGVETLSMETVADRAGVSRPLVYKHFGNRGDILVAVFRREAELLHAEMAEPVRAASTLEEAYRALVQTSFAAWVERGPLFAALRSAGAFNPELRREREARDRRTVRFFASLASEQYGIPPAEAAAATAMLLTALESVMAQYRARRTRAQAAMLEETYLDVILGGLERLTERTRPRRTQASR